MVTLEIRLDIFHFISAYLLVLIFYLVIGVYVELGHYLLVVIIIIDFQ